MSDLADPSSAGHPDPAGESNTLSPLPGEPGIPNVAERRRVAMSKKGLLAVGLLIGSLVAVAAASIQRFAASGKNDDVPDAKLASGRPTAASAEPSKLEMPALPPVIPQSATARRIPALVPTAEEAAEPIGVHRTGQRAAASGTGAGPAALSPEDAPVMLIATRPVAGTMPETTAGAADVGTDPGAGTTEIPPESNAAAGSPVDSTTRNLEGYQRQLRGLLDTLTRSTAMAAGAATGQRPSATAYGASPAGGHLPGSPATGPNRSLGGDLLGGQLQGSATPRVEAGTLAHRSLTLPKGTAFTCALTTRVVSATSGLVGCQVQRNVFGDDGRVLLIERGSHLDGEYRVTSVRRGTVRIPVLWTRIRTPNGVTVDIDSPGTGQLGESGIDGYVDNRWSERIGAAMLLSLIDDSVQLVIQDQANRSQNTGQNNTVLLPSTTANTSKLAEKVLDSTINIPPLIYQNQGGIVGIYVARDVDFSSVYGLKPTATAPAREGTP